MTEPKHGRPEQRLLQELAAQGYTVKSVYDFVNDRENDYARAMPVLVAYLPLVQDRKTKEGVIRALGVKGYTDAVKPLMEEFKKTTDPHLQWAIGNSLGLIDAGVQVEEVIGMIEGVRSERPAQWPNEIKKDPQNMAIENLLLVLGKTKDPKALPVLRRYLKNEHLAEHALEGLKNFENHS